MPGARTPLTLGRNISHMGLRNVLRKRRKARRQREREKEIREQFEGWTDKAKQVPFAG